MVQLNNDLCNFLRKLNNQFESFSNGVIIVKNGILRGLTFKINDKEGYVHVNEHFDLDFDAEKTSLQNLVHYLYQCRIITNSDLKVINSVQQEGA